MLIIGHIAFRFLFANDYSANEETLSYNDLSNTVALEAVNPLDLKTEEEEQIIYAIFAAENN